MSLEKEKAFLVKLGKSTIVPCSNLLSRRLGYPSGDLYYYPLAETEYYIATNFATYHKNSKKFFVRGGARIYRKWEEADSKGRSEGVSYAVLRLIPRPRQKAVWNSITKEFRLNCAEHGFTWLRM